MLATATSESERSVLLCSASVLKVKATRQFFEELGPVRIITLNCDECGLPPQPVCDHAEEGFCFAQERMNFARLHTSFDDYDYVVSVENVLCDVVNDRACVLMYSRGALGKGLSLAAQIPSTIIGKLHEQPRIYYDARASIPLSGYQNSAGDLLHAANPEIESKNWMDTTCGLDRVEQMRGAIANAFRDLSGAIKIGQTLMLSIAKYPDFPKPGVLFEDVFPLFGQKNLRAMVKLFAQHYAHNRIDVVVGLESRGFCFGTVLAYELNAGFVPIRKLGKLPGDLWSQTYEKEYGSDTCEMQHRALHKGQRVLIVDDLIATGGSMQAACLLVERTEAIIVDCCVLRNVAALKTTCDACLKPYPYTVLLQALQPESPQSQTQATRETQAMQEKQAMREKQAMQENEPIRFETIRFETERDLLDAFAERIEKIRSSSL